MCLSGTDISCCLLVSPPALLVAAPVSCKPLEQRQTGTDTTRRVLCIAFFEPVAEESVMGQAANGLAKQREKPDLALDPPGRAVIGEYCDDETRIVVVGAAERRDNLFH